MSNRSAAGAGPGTPGDPSAGKILVSDGDPGILRAVTETLRSAGHEVVTAATGEEALHLAQEHLPWLVILDVGLSGLSGYEVCRRLRSDWLFADRGIIMLTSDSSSGERERGLSVGADDVVLKPLSPSELAARVRLTLGRVQAMRSSSPLTGLPGNVHIEQELRRRVKTGTGVALLYVDIDHFKAYNDHYGFLRGDEAIRTLGDVLRKAIDGRPQSFLGHVGGDDFVILARPADAEGIAHDVLSAFEGVVKELYEPRDAARGWFQLRDRRGRKHRQGLLTLSIGVATSIGRTADGHRRLVDVATEMKEYAKSDAGSSVAVDRRRRGTSVPRGRRLLWRRLARLAAHPAAALTTMLLIAGPATIVVAENARPGDILWPVKLGIEDARLFIERNPEKDAALHMEFASRRLGDLQWVRSRGIYSATIAGITESLAEHTSAAVDLVRRLTHEGLDTRVLRGQASELLRQNVEVLEGLVATACAETDDRTAPSDAACAGLQRALASASGAMTTMGQLKQSDAAPGGGRPTEPPGRERGEAAGSESSRGRGGKASPGSSQEQPGKQKKEQPPGNTSSPAGKGEPTSPKGKGKEQGQSTGQEQPAKGKKEQAPGQGKKDQPSEPAAPEPGTGQGSGQEKPKKGKQPTPSSPSE